MPDRGQQTALPGGWFGSPPGRLLGRCREREHLAAVRAKPRVPDEQLFRPKTNHQERGKARDEAQPWEPVVGLRKSREGDGEEGREERRHAASECQNETRETGGDPREAVFAGAHDPNDKATGAMLTCRRGDGKIVAALRAKSSRHAARRVAPRTGDWTRGHSSGFLYRLAGQITVLTQGLHPCRHLAE
ncbi:MAG: hypothetical protein E6H91_01210 [Chloroflexi bacterium]|nr:MAG: hypothetical protein E6H91_01210 [Chloroflexota bacterium]